MRYFFINGTGYACAEYTMIPARDGFFIRLLGTDIRCFFFFPKIEEVRKERNQAEILGKKINEIKIDTKTQTYEIVYQ